LDELYENQKEFLDELAKLEAVTSDVHTCVAKWSISWEGTFLSKVNHKIVVKLNTGCVQNVVTAWRCRLGRPLLGTDAEDFFQGTCHTYPHLNEVHVVYIYVLFYDTEAPDHIQDSLI
jgi:hypothetical protein